MWGWRAAAHSAMRAANTGDSSRSCAPMPTHCDPWPGKMNATLRSRSATPLVSTPSMITARWSKSGRRLRL